MWYNEYYENVHKCSNEENMHQKEVYFIKILGLVKHMGMLEQVFSRRMIEFLVNDVGVPKPKEVSPSQPPRV